MLDEQNNYFFKDTTATEKIFGLRGRIRAVAGGTSASKTISILVWLIDYLQNPTHKNKLATVVSESYPHLEKGAMLDFEGLMKDRGYWKDDSWNKTKHVYTFETGNKLEFFSADTYGKAHGPRRDILFINEANNLEYNIVDQLIVRTREIVWLDWNPSSEFWFYTEMLPNRDDIDFITLTYKDNEALDDITIAEIESHKNNKMWWTVYGLGQLGEIETRIYTGWQLIDEIPYEARLERRGLDFGYSNDPSAIVDVYYYNGGYIFDEKLYRKGMSNKQLADFLLSLGYVLVVADSAEPKSIDEITSYGVSIVPAVKGRDSVNQGIQYVQDQKISVTKRSLNLIKEYRNYLWETDKNGKVINTPIDAYSHCFVGNTEVRTADGYKQIRDIKKGDWVQTSKGIRPVVKRWNNGTKQVSKYSLQFDTFNVILEATPDHLIKTTKGWKKISKLQSGMEIYHNNYLGIKSTDSIQKKSISQEEQSECTQKSGSTSMAQFLKDFMFTTKTKIRGTIARIIYFLKKGEFISLSMARKGFSTIPVSPNPSKQKEFKWLKFGTLAPMGLNGIKGTELKFMQRGSLLSIYVNNAGNIIKQDIQAYPNIAIKTAKLVRLDVGESRKEKVYDIEVEDCHEYFANTILVHNCLDSVRYALEGLRNQQPKVYVPTNADVARRRYRIGQ